VDGPFGGALHGGYENGVESDGQGVSGPNRAFHASNLGGSDVVLCKHRKLAAAGGKGLRSTPSSSEARDRHEF
jgi:hypothetical protein